MHDGKYILLMKSRYTGTDSTSYHHVNGVVFVDYSRWFIIFSLYIHIVKFDELLDPELCKRNDQLNLITDSHELIFGCKHEGFECDLHSRIN